MQFRVFIRVYLYYIENCNLTFWYLIEEHFLENTMILTCSFPLQSYGYYKNHFCIHVNGDVNFDRLVYENMFTSHMTDFPKTTHCGWELATREDTNQGKLTI